MRMELQAPYHPYPAVHNLQPMYLLKRFDTSQYGGAPLLGLKGLVVKTHGSSKANEICNSILQCVTFTEQRMNEKIRAGIQAKENQEGNGSHGI